MFVYCFERRTDRVRARKPAPAQPTAQFIQRQTVVWE